jgi:hypothetical protein
MHCLGIDTAAVTVQGTMPVQTMTVEMLSMKAMPVAAEYSCATMDPGKCLVQR